MKKTFKSKVEWIIMIPLAIILTTAEIYMILHKVWPAAVLVALVSFFLIYLYRVTRYELTGDNKLRIRIGFLYSKEIAVQTIRKIKPIRNILASPALSRDRLEIFFNRYESVMISPNQKSDFINQLKQRNPRIRVG